MSPDSKWDAALYDEKHSFVWKMAAGVLELLAPKSGENILDIGCGTGHLTAQLAASGAKVTGIDRSPEMIAQARSANPSIRFEVADARGLKFMTEFDAVFSNATLHWVTEPERAIISIENALRRGGRFVAEFGGKGNIAGLVSAVSAAWQNLHLPGPVPNPWYYPSIGEYSTLLERHRLEITFASLFDRPTPLEDGDRGLRNWLNMFGGPFLEKIPANLQEKFSSEVESQARYALFRNGRWVMDYRRLRVQARRL
jgi:trans-aconitate methyltransferase